MPLGWYVDGKPHHCVSCCVDVMCSKDVHFILDTGIVENSQVFCTLVC